MSHRDTATDAGPALASGDALAMFLANQWCPPPKPARPDRPAKPPRPPRPAKAPRPPRAARPARLARIAANDPRWARLCLLVAIKLERRPAARALAGSLTRTRLDASCSSTRLAQAPLEHFDPLPLELL